MLILFWATSKYLPVTFWVCLLEDVIRRVNLAGVVQSV
jgi:hypothetical protein